MSNANGQLQHARQHQAPKQRLPPLHSRTRELPAGDESTGQKLILGEFARVPTLSLSEARILISHVLEGRRRQQGGAAPLLVGTSDNALGKTQEHLDMFARFKEQSAVMAVESALRELEPRIEHFERAQLGNLCANDAEEARNLIPSLEGKFDDETLDEVLDKILKARALA